MYMYMGKERKRWIKTKGGEKRVREMGEGSDKIALKEKR